MAGPDNDLDRPRSVPTVFLSAMASAASTDPASPLEHRRQIEPTVAGPFAGDMIRKLRKPHVDAMITAACASSADRPETRQWTQCSPTCAPTSRPWAAVVDEYARPAGIVTRWWSRSSVAYTNRAAPSGAETTGHRAHDPRQANGDHPPSPRAVHRSVTTVTSRTTIRSMDARQAEASHGPS